MLHVVLDGAGLVGRDGTEAQRSGAAAAAVTCEETQRAGAAATRLVLLQDLHYLSNDRQQRVISPQVWTHPPPPFSRPIYWPNVEEKEVEDDSN